MKRYFLNLSDDELIKKVKFCDDKINQYQKPINEYDKYLEIFKKTKNDNIEAHKDNPIVLQELSNLKLNSDGSSSYVMLKDVHVKELNNNMYLLTKGGNRFFYTEMMDHFVKNKRQMELILRGRKREKEQTENVGFVYVLSNKSLPKNTFKIGSTYGDPEDRAEDLTGTGHLYHFKVESKIKIKAAEYYEKKIHSLLDNYRVKQGREFFELELDKIKDCLQQVSILSEKGQKKVSLADLKKKIKIK